MYTLFSQRTRNYVVFLVQFLLAEASDTECWSVTCKKKLACSHLRYPFMATWSSPLLAFYAAMRRFMNVKHTSMTIKIVLCRSDFRSVIWGDGQLPQKTHSCAHFIKAQTLRPVYSVRVKHEPSISGRLEESKVKSRRGFFPHSVIPWKVRGSSFTRWNVPITNVRHGEWKILWHF